jgi:hypothetical protein
VDPPAPEFLSPTKGTHHTSGSENFLIYYVGFPLDFLFIRKNSLHDNIQPKKFASRLVVKASVSLNDNINSLQY